MFATGYKSMMIFTRDVWDVEERRGGEGEGERRSKKGKRSENKGKQRGERGRGEEERGRGRGGGGGTYLVVGGPKKSSLRKYDRPREFYSSCGKLTLTEDLQKYLVEIQHIQVQKKLIDESLYTGSATLIILCLFRVRSSFQKQSVRIHDNIM